MIQLDPSITATYTWLTTPPTYAQVQYHNTDIQNKGVSGAYLLGTLINGAFTPSDPLLTQSFYFNKAPVNGATDPTTEALGNLLNAGVVPSPTSPSTAVTVASKKAGDFKIADLDALVANLIPNLKGTVA